MAAVIQIDGEVLGKKKPLFHDWSFRLPDDWGEGGLTLREFIAKIVRSEVEAFRQRQEQRRLSRVLSKSEFKEGAQRGKIDSGGRDLDQRVDIDDAIHVAWEAFEDGIYLVVIDGRQYRDLEAQVFLSDESRVTFLRLVMLAGG